MEDNIFRKITNKHTNSILAATNALAPSDLHGTYSLKFVFTTNALWLADIAINIVCHLCVQGAPPQHHRFKDPRIPVHMTYAYKADVAIIENDAFYTLPNDKRKTIDLVFLIANAPVSTASLPGDGSESYVGEAMIMELAMEELISEELLSQELSVFFSESS